MRISYSTWLFVLFSVTLGTAGSQAEGQAQPQPAALPGGASKVAAANALQHGVPRDDDTAGGRTSVAELQATAPSAAESFLTAFTFAEMSDGVQIALAIGFPRSVERDAMQPIWPAMFEMMGYPDSTVPRSPRDFGDRYVTVRASVRGAGASGGTIRAISERTGWDGHEIIENWIVKQPWSNGKVALHGHSWGGLTGLMIAATNPKHLTAVAVSGLFDDVYRDIGRVGGVRNCGFPVNWLINLYKPTGPFESGEAAIQARGMTRAEYDAIVAGRPPWDLTGGLLWHALHSEEDTAQFAAASPGAFAAGVRAPIHLMHAYQDEQTGPSGAWIWHYLPDDIPKRLVLSNGDHGDVQRFQRERLEWLNFWTLGEGNTPRTDFTDRGRRVQVYFETPAHSDGVNEPLVSADFPLPETDWTRYYLREDHRLSVESPALESAPSGDSFRVAVAQGDQVDGVHYLLDFGENAAICGPICASLWIRCTTVDTDLFVMVADVAPDGAIQLLQRGLLRASHRTLDRRKSMWISRDDQSILVRPRHTHRGLQPVVPGEPFRMDVEVFPVGHVFRAGHQLGLWIGQPPQNDPVTRHSDGRPAYQYDTAMPPATVTVLRDRDHASSILIPRLPRLPPLRRTPLAPGGQAGVHVWTAPGKGG